VPLLASRVRAKAEEIIYNRIGTNVAPGKPEYVQEKGKGFWSVPLEVDLPRVIEDKRTGKLNYVVFHLGNLGLLQIDDRTLQPTETPKRSDLNSAIEEKLLHIRNQVENLLLQTASLQFARLVSIKHMMTPLSNLITSVLKHDSYNIPETQATWRSVLAYAKFLEKKGFILRDGNEVRPSAILQELYQKVGADIDSTLEYVLTDVIKNNYETVYKDFRVTALSPYVQISSSYYDYALSAHDLIALSEDDLWDAYSTLYGSTSTKRHFRFDDYLRELSHETVGLLRHNEGFWQGDEKVFERLSNNFESLGGIVS
jgi:hypothetical protein